MRTRVNAGFRHGSDVACSIHLTMLRKQSDVPTETLCAALVVFHPEDLIEASVHPLEASQTRVACAVIDNDSRLPVPRLLRRLVGSSRA